MVLSGKAFAIFIILFGLPLKSNCALKPGITVSNTEVGAEPNCNLDVIPEVTPCVFAPVTGPIEPSVTGPGALGSKVVERMLRVKTPTFVIIFSGLLPSGK